MSDITVGWQAKNSHCSKAVSAAEPGSKFVALHWQWSPYKWKSNGMNNLLKTNNLFRSSNSSNFFRLSGRLSLARWISRNVSRVLKPVSFFKSSSFDCSKSFFSIFVTSYSWRVNTTTIEFFSIAISGSGIKKKWDGFTFDLNPSFRQILYRGKVRLRPNGTISLLWPRNLIFRSKPITLVCIVNKINT